MHADDTVLVHGFDEPRPGEDDAFLYDHGAIDHDDVVGGGGPGEVTLEQMVEAIRGHPEVFGVEELPRLGPDLTLRDRHALLGEHGRT
ncbi:MAG: hypothetical protein AAF715_30070 [Myxococcota bacterium]